MPNDGKFINVSALGEQKEFVEQVRCRALEAELLAGDGVGEAEDAGMQGDPPHGLHRFHERLRPCGPPSRLVDGITEDGVADAGQMHADLVGAAGVQGDMQPGDTSACRLHQAIVGERPLAALPAPFNHGHALAVPWVAADGLVDLPLGGRDAVYDGFIDALDGVDGKLAGKAVMRPIMLGDDQEAAHILVQPVDDARSLHSANTGKAVAAMSEQSMHQRALLMAGCRVDDEACGFLEHQQMLVLVDDVEHRRLGLEGHGLELGNVDGQALTVFDPAAGLGYLLPVDAHMAVSDQALQARSRVAVKAFGKIAVEPLPLGVGLDLEGRGGGGLRHG